jgi:hypothetical protein
MREEICPDQLALIYPVPANETPYCPPHWWYRDKPTTTLWRCRKCKAKRRFREWKPSGVDTNEVTGVENVVVS